jgi:tripeptide aminopeptidase
VKEKLLKRFLQYVSFDTQSKEGADTFPSTATQKIFAEFLCDELRAVGLNAIVDENSYVYASLPSNSSSQIPAVGFISHMDTSPDMPGNGFVPKIIYDYNGGDILLNAENNILLRVSEYPELLNYSGQTLITTNGTTLLGADDKAGIAEIITAMEYLIQHPEIEQGDVKIAFTPDEEIGRGVDFFNIEKFGADFAYTVDGGAPGELEYENFNAARANIGITGNNIHPGYAKNKMMNALHLAMEFNALLPVHSRPEHTEGREGFFHLTKFEGTVENAAMQYIIRDHDKHLFEKKKKLIISCAEFLNRKYGMEIFSVETKDQYYNMREKIEPVYHIVEYAEQAMTEAGFEALIVPVRGGTDGARLSYKGLPCPNIFTGGHNFHGKYEFISLESMEKAVQVILNIIRLVTTKNK